MSAKKTTEEITPTDAQEEVPAYAVKPQLCGHVNRHHINANGVREGLACTLEKGHEGDHSAPYRCLRPADGSIEQARAIVDGTPVLRLSGRMVGRDFVKTEYVEVTETAYWSDAAGTPPENIKPDLEQLAHIKKTKGAMLDAAQLERRTAV